MGGSLGIALFNRGADARIVLLAQLGVLCLVSFDSEHATQDSQLKCSRPILSCVLPGLVQRVPLRVRAPELRLHCRVCVHHRLPGTRHLVHELRGRIHPLGGLRLHEHGSQPYLRLHLHLL